MVQKWAIGAMINISGSISINLGTNLMKLSHKMEKGELGPSANHKAPSANHKSSPVPPSEVDTAARSNGTASSPRGKTLAGTLAGSFLNRSRLVGSKAKNQLTVEMTPYSVVPTDSHTEPGSDPQVCGEHEAMLGRNGSGGRPQRVRRVSPGRARGSPGRGFEEDAGGMREDSLTASPSSATAFSVSSDDRAVGKTARVTSAASRPAYGRSEGSRNAGICSDNEGDVGQGYGSDLDDHRGVRRRSASSHPDELVALVGSEEAGGRGGGGGAEFEWKTKALWYIGAFLLVAGSLVNFASFGFAPQSLLASLGSVQFISNVIFGKVILHEVVTRRVIAGTGTIILGNTLTLCFSPHQEKNYTTHELKAFYDLGYNSLLLFELVVALAMHTTYKIFRSSKEQGKPRRYSDLVMPLSYAICSAIIGTQSVVQAKCFSELLTSTLRGSNQMGSPFTYLVIAVWLGTTVFWLMRMNRALAMFHGLFIIPALQVFWTFFSVIGGGFYFEEFSSLKLLGGLGFALGVLVVFLGVYLLAPRTQTGHGRRSIAGRWEEGDVLEEDESDLTRMLRMEDDISPVPSPVRPRVTPKHRATPKHHPPMEEMEAGDEEIDWDHTRMVSLAFFPSISTDQDVGYLTNTFESPEHEGVGRHGPELLEENAQGDTGMSEHAKQRLPLGPLRQKDTPPRFDSPSASLQPSTGPPFSDADGLALGADLEAGSRVSGEDVDHRRRRGGGRLVEGRAGGGGGGGGGGGRGRGRKGLVTAGDEKSVWTKAVKNVARVCFVGCEPWMYPGIYPGCTRVYTGYESCV